MCDLCSPTGPCGDRSCVLGPAPAFTFLCYPLKMLSNFILEPVFRKGSPMGQWGHSTHVSRQDRQKERKDFVF